VAAISEKTIRESLIRQLEAQNRKTAYTLEKVEEYMTWYRIRRELAEDIKARGVKVKEPDSKGQIKVKTNGSVLDLVKATNAGNSILSLLGLQNPVAERSADDYL